MNYIILRAGSNMHERLRSAAGQWIASGRDRSRLLSGTAFFLAQCWLYSSGAFKTGSPLFEKVVSDYVAASKAALGGEEAWNAMLTQRESCRHCSMSFHLENLGICADCFEYVCPSCRPAHAAGCRGELAG
jgi:hypothetical protein